MITITAFFCLGAIELQDKHRQRAFKKCWEVDTADSARPFVYVGEQIIMTNGSGKIRSIDTKTGLNLWTTDVGGEFISDLVVYGNDIYVVTSHTRSLNGESKTAVLLSIAIGSGITNSQVELPFSNDFYLVPSVHGIVVASSKGAVILTTHDLSNIIWKHDLNSGTVHKLVTKDELIGLITGESSVLLLETQSGRVVLSKDFKTVLREILISGDRSLFIGDVRGAVSKVDITKGVEDWRFKSGGAVLSIDISDRSLLVSSADNFIYKMNANSGKVDWRKRLNGRPIARPTIYDDNIYVNDMGDRSTLLIALSNGKTFNRIEIGAEDTFLSVPIGIHKGSIIRQFVDSLVFSTQESCE